MNTTVRHIFQWLATSVLLAGGLGWGGTNALAAARPQPWDLDFYRVKGPLTAYVHSLPAERQTDAKERIRELSLMRGYLVSLLKFIPFDGKERGIRLRDGNTIYGTVLGNETELVVRPLRGQYRKIRWNELALAQYPVFFEFYIQQRLGRSDPSVSQAENLTAQKRDVGGDYFRLALLCDWYGNSTLAAKYAKLAVASDQELKPRVDQFSIGQMTRENQAVN